MSCHLSASIVLYYQSLELFQRVFQNFLCSNRNIRNRFHRSHLYLVDNGGSIETLSYIKNQEQSWMACMHLECITEQNNIGFGKAHNLCIDRTSANYHLILNPDVELAPDALINAITFLESHPECGLLSPKSTDTKNQQQFLCKRYPAISDLLLRGLAPEWIKRIFQKRLDLYEMKDVVGDNIYWDPPIVSGCFMLFRTSVLKQLGGFDPRFFLYFEDFDLSLRASRITRIAYVPSVKIVHHGGNAARKGIRHIFFFLESAVKFFNKHGWKFF